MQFGLSHVFGRVAPGTSGSGMKVYVVYLVQKQKRLIQSGVSDRH